MSHPRSSPTGRSLPGHHVREAILGAAALAVVAFLALGVRFDPAFSQFDGASVGRVHGIATELGGSLMQAVADLAASNTVLGLTVVVAALLVLRRHWHGALALSVSVAATQGLVAIVKHLVARDRPSADDALVHASGYSFPSAHSATSVALYGVIALIAAHELGRGAPRRAVIASAVAVCAAVGVSRVYLGAHYPTDVLAGWLLGSVIALASWRGALAVRRQVAPSVA